jgi:hypothetical protein
MILETALRNVLADAIDNEINTGAGIATFVFETAGDVEVATIDLQNPAFGAAAAGVITLAGVPLSDTSATGGTTVQASVFDRDASKQFELTVGTSGTEIIISSTVIGATDQVDLTALTITVPAS